MQTLVIGYGSIGKRHARLLAELGCAVAVVSSQPCAEHPCFATIAEALASAAPDYVVIASITSRHHADLALLADAGFTGTVLVEKPLFMDMPTPTPSYPFTVYVAYNLRFHPVIVALQQALAGQTVLLANAYVGQHLAQWRPDRATYDNYSAHKNQGGGVVRDLSHELDLAQHLFGALQFQAGLAARVGEVTADSEDSASCLLSAQHCPHVLVHMNYLDHQPTRIWRIITAQHSIEANLIAGTITTNGAAQQISFTADDSYRAMHAALIAGNSTLHCSYAQGLALNQLIAKLAP